MAVFKAAPPHSVPAPSGQGLFEVVGAVFHLIQARHWEDFGNDETLVFAFIELYFADLPAQ